MKTRFFRVIEGSHFDSKGKEYTKNQTVRSPLDLCEQFPGKFQEVTADMASLQSAARAEAASTSEPEEFKGFGKDVTSAFEAAAKAGLKVYKNELKKYFVVDPEGDPKKALNRKPLSKSDVEAFIELQTA